MKSLHHHNLIHTSIIIHSTESFSHSVILPSGFHYYLLHRFTWFWFLSFYLIWFFSPWPHFLSFSPSFLHILMSPSCSNSHSSPSVSNKIPSLCFIRAPNHSFPPLFSLQSMQSLSSSVCSCLRCWSRCTVWASSPTSIPHSTASTVWWVHKLTH